MQVLTICITRTSATLYLIQDEGHVAAHNFCDVESRHSQIEAIWPALDDFELPKHPQVFALADMLRIDE